MSRETEAKSDLRDERVGRSVFKLGCYFSGEKVHEYEFVGMSVRFPDQGSDEFLVTLRALDHEGAPVVAFHAAPNLDEVLKGLLARIENGQLKWKADKWGR